jgi:hypothetical protein
MFRSACDSVLQNVSTFFHVALSDDLRSIKVASEDIEPSFPALSRLSANAAVGSGRSNLTPPLAAGFSCLDNIACQLRNSSKP